MILQNNYYSFHAFATGNICNIWISTSDTYFISASQSIYYGDIFQVIIRWTSTGYLFTYFSYIYNNFIYEKYIPSHPCECCS